MTETDTADDDWFQTKLRAAQDAAEERRRKYTPFPAWDLVRHAHLTMEYCELLATGHLQHPPIGAGGSLRIDGEYVGSYCATPKGLGYTPGWAADLRDCDPRLTWIQVARLLRERLPGDLVAAMPDAWAEQCRLHGIYSEASHLTSGSLADITDQARAERDTAHRAQYEHWITRIRDPLQAAMAAAVAPEQTTIFDHLEETW